MYGPSGSSASLAEYSCGEMIPIGSSHVRKKKIARILFVNMVTFIGKAMAMNLSTVINTRLEIETEYETCVQYFPSLHPNEDYESAKNRKSAT